MLHVKVPVPLSVPVPRLLQLPRRPHPLYRLHLHMSLLHPTEASKRTVMVRSQYIRSWMYPSIFFTFKYDNGVARSIADIIKGYFTESHPNWTHTPKHVKKTCKSGIVTSRSTRK